MDNLIGKKFGRWTVQSHSHHILDNRGQKLNYFNCVCECGTQKSVRRSNLVTGASLSCGCLNLERTVTHGRHQSPEYRVWHNMVCRCHRETNRDYKSYGGRGIRVCDSWKESFQSFFADMGERPSSKHELDRINNDGNYEPGNCRWVTKKENNRNKRTNVMITAGTKTLCLEDWAIELGVGPSCIRKRLSQGKNVYGVIQN